MGTWETGIYQNDLSLDVRDDYIGKLKAGKSDEDALNEILEKYKEEADDIDCKYDFYIALADTMWKKGRLTEELKTKALEMIEEDKVSDRWEDERVRKERAKKLDKVKEKLNGPMPERKKVSVHKPYKLGWNEGDVYTFTLTENVKGNEKYIGWHVLFYVDSIYTKDWYVHGIEDEIADVYFFMMKDKPESVGDIKKAKNIRFFHKVLARHEKYKRGILETSKKQRPMDLKYLGKCECFPCPAFVPVYKEKGECFTWGYVGERDIMDGYENQLKYEREIMEKGIL